MTNEPVYALNNYVWKLLQDKMDWDAVNYNGKTPIIPASQQPEFNSYHSPFIVYGSTTDPSSSDYIENVEIAAYSVYAATVSEVNAVLKIINRALRRFDRSAADVNLWLHGQDNDIAALFDDVMFKWIRVSTVQRAMPADEEGGRLSGYMVIRYAFFDDANGAEFVLH